MKTRIISAFPGTGKSYFYNENKETTIDSDSSEFSWVKDEQGNNTKERNPNFPQNYIDHIKENIGKYEFIFVSSHKEVRDALKYNCIFFYLVYPADRRKEEFIKRYIDRGSPSGFVKLIENKWEEWLKECEFETYGCSNVIMILPNLSDELSHIIASENGDSL
jgi:hypothetical protein